MSEEFQQTKDKFEQTISQCRKESEAQMAEVCNELDGLVKFVKLNRKEYKKERDERQKNTDRQGSQRAPPRQRQAAAADKDSTGRLDVTDEMLNLFVRFDI